MNRMPRESLAGGRKIPADASALGLQQNWRKGRGLDAMAGGVAEGGGDDGLDLFSKNCRRGHSIGMADESDGQNVPPNLSRVSIGSGKLVRSGMDDLLSAADIGKNDYDWLLTPPGTPLISSSDASEPQLTSVGPRSNVSARSSSTTTTSRFSATQTENNNHSTRPARSSSAARPSVSATYSSSHFSTNSIRTSVLNTSSGSVTSFRPSTPANYSNTLSNSRQPALISRPMPARSCTPAKTRPHGSSTGDKFRPANCSRPSTPTSRPQVPTNINSSSNITCSSRPSTPTRRTPAPSTTPLTSRSPTVGRALATNSKNTASASRPSSPSPRVKATTPPLVLPDFPLDVPPNLRTKLPDRPISVGRTRPGAALTVRANSNSDVGPIANSSRKQASSPIVTKGRFPENTVKSRLPNSGHEAGPPELHKPLISVVAVRKQSKPAASATTATESTGFGRTISKKSLDMALRHMDIRQSMNSVRGTSIFPQSVRLTATKGHPARMSDLVVPVVSNGFESKDAYPNRPNSDVSSATISENGHTIAQSSDKECFLGRGSDSGTISENGHTIAQSLDKECVLGRASETDIYGSSRYEAIMLKEDLKNMNWLHSVDDKSDQSPLFDHRFEQLPEPFGLL